MKSIQQLEKSVSLVKMMVEFKPSLISILSYEKINNDIENGEVVRQYLSKLMSIPVTNISRFSDNSWDYNNDVLNPPRSVQGSKLRIDFSEYSNIPPYVITEMKCLFLLTVLLPVEFRKKYDKRANRKSIKPNTIIAQFKSGLRFLDAVFNELNLLGTEYVQSHFQSLTDVLDRDFRIVAKTYGYSVDSAINQFFYYISHPLATKIFGDSLKVDFSTLDWPEQAVKKKKERIILENREFETLLNHSTYTVIDFLIRISEEIEDSIALKHFRMLNQKRDLSFEFNKDVLNDYTLMRLWSKGYSQSYIASKCVISADYFDSSGILLPHENIRLRMKKKYAISHFNDVRLYVNEVYYSAAYIISQLTGMRPEELSGIRISECLIDHEGFDVIVSNVKKSEFENLELFDDKWVAIPIMKDAINSALQLSVLKNNDFLLSNVDTVSPDRKQSSMGPGGIKEFFNNFFCVVLGAKRTKELCFSAYILRHTLAYQLYRIELGLPFISFQLKHVVESVEQYTSFGSASKTTLGYGEIAEAITTSKTTNKKILKEANLERVKSVMDPDATYVGTKGKEHKTRLKQVFKGYQEAGYSKEEVFEAMVEQGLAVINVGQGFCFGGVDDTDSNLPCIGSLKCNPNRCKNAVVSKANVPKWREVYVKNKELLDRPEYGDRKAQLSAAIEEAKGVLILLGEDIH